MFTGVATINDVPSVVFLNFGVEPQSAVGSIQDLRTDYSKMNKIWRTTILNLMKLVVSFPKWYKTLEKRRNCVLRPNLLVPQCFQIFVL